jgi:dTMP kinase
MIAGSGARGRSPRGAFIVLEGADGAGKTTQANRLAAELERRGLAVTRVREPGGTPIGEKVRAVLLDPENEVMDARAELLLFMASRAQLCRDVIAPAIDAGRVVIADRFLASSAVYQGLVGGLGVERVLALGDFATGGVRPDVTILLDLSPEEAAARMGEGRVRDRIEQKDMSYHRQVFAGYLEYAKLASERVVRVYANREPDAVFADVWAVAETVLPLGARAS